MTDLPNQSDPVVDRDLLITPVWYRVLDGISRNAALAIRSPLLGDTTLYVRSDGLATGTIQVAALADTAAGSFATWQAAYDYVCKRVDTQGYTVTLRKGSGGSGTFSAAYGVLIGNRSWTGGGEIVIDGGSSASCEIIASNTCIYLQGVMGGGVTIKNIKLTCSGGDCIRHVAVGTLTIGDDVDFGDCAVAHIEAHNSGCIVNILNVSYTISGDAPFAHIWAHSNASIYHEASTVTLTGTPAFAIFAAANTNGVVQSSDSTFSGAATGLRFYVSTGGQITTAGAGAGLTYFPGDTAGAEDVTSFGKYT